MIRFALLAFVNIIVVSAGFGKVSAAVRGAIDCQTANGRRPVVGITMRLMDWDLFDPNDVLNTTTTNASGAYYLEGEEHEVGVTTIFAEAWFPCSGKVFDQCKNAAFQAQCDTLKHKKNCHKVIELLLIPKDKYYTEEKDKDVHDAGRYMLDTDKISKSYMHCD